MVLLASSPDRPPSLKHTLPLQPERNLKNWHLRAGVSSLLWSIKALRLNPTPEFSTSLLACSYLVGNASLSLTFLPPLSNRHTATVSCLHFQPSFLSLTHIHKAGQAWTYQHLNLPSRRPSLLGFKLPVFFPVSPHNACPTRTETSPALFT